MSGYRRFIEQEHLDVAVQILCAMIQFKGPALDPGDAAERAAIQAGHMLNNITNRYRRWRDNEAEAG